MKLIHFLKAVLVGAAVCVFMLCGCAKETPDITTTVTPTQAATEATEPVTEATEPVTEAATEATEPVTEVTEPVTEPEETDSLLTDHSWSAVQEGSTLTFGTDGTFKYSRFADEPDKEYYAGTYIFKRSGDAYDYLTEDLSEYGITAEKLLDYFLTNAGTQYNYNNLVCLVLNKDSHIKEGEEVIPQPISTPYFGFVLEDETGIYLDIANMTTGDYTTFQTAE